MYLHDITCYCYACLSVSEQLTPASTNHDHVLQHPSLSFRQTSPTRLSIIHVIHLSLHDASLRTFAYFLVLTVLILKEPTKIWSEMESPLRSTENFWARKDRAFLGGGGGKEGSYNNRDKSAVIKSKSFYTLCDADAAPGRCGPYDHLGGLASSEIEIQICGAAVGESVRRYEVVGK